MRSKAFIVWLGVIALALLVPTGAMAQGEIPPPYGIDLNPYEPDPITEEPPPYYGEIIEVPPGDVETLWFHILEPGLWHAYEWSFHVAVLSGSGSAVVETQDVRTSIEYQGSKWYKFGTIRVNGEPSTTLAIQIDLTTQGGVTWWSNSVYKHITPEPSSMLALGTGLFGLGGLLLRRRRS